MAAVFRDIIQSESAEGTARAITRSTEPDLSSETIAAMRICPTGGTRILEILRGLL